MKEYPTTPDGRYFVVKGRLWRCSSPLLKAEQRAELVRQLMVARRSVRTAIQNKDEQALRQARDDVNRAKIALGERGGVWWKDGAPDYNRKEVRFTPYASWHANLQARED